MQSPPSSISRRLRARWYPGDYEHSQWIRLVNSPFSCSFKHIWCLDDFRSDACTFCVWCLSQRATFYWQPRTIVCALSYFANWMLMSTINCYSCQLLSPLNQRILTQRFHSSIISCAYRSHCCGRNRSSGNVEEYYLKCARSFLPSYQCSTGQSLSSRWWAEVNRWSVVAANLFYNRYATIPVSSRRHSVNSKHPTQIGVADY